jgi:hypothetical protein
MDVLGFVDFKVVFEAVTNGVVDFGVDVCLVSVVFEFGFVVVAFVLLAIVVVGGVVVVVVVVVGIVVVVVVAVVVVVVVVAGGDIDDIQ